MLEIYDLKCEYFSNPTCIDTKKPRFFWKIKSDGKNIMQQAYEIEVEGVWKSGKIEDSASIQVEYAGLPLEPETKYSYTLKVWDNRGEYAEKSGYFETGLMDKSRFTAKFISADSDIAVFRKKFAADGRVKSAKIYAAAYGTYDIYMNGARVGDEYLAPGFTSYKKRLQYRMYDVTDLISANNAIGITVAPGWCRGTIGWGNQKNFFGFKCAAAVQIAITYENGEKELVATDESWRVLPSEVTYSDIYNGEICDARKILPCSEPSFDDTNYPFAAVENYGNENIVSSVSAPVRIVKTVKPIEIIKTPLGETVIDFGQNMVGWAEFTVTGKAGEKVCIDHAEVLDKEGNFYTENLRSAKERVEYILKDGTQTYHPRFTFQGFRYIRINEFPGEVSLDNFTGRVICTDMNRTGYFECSDKLVNKLYENVIWGQMGNFVDIPTDCPQRDERLGWTGDAQVFVSTASVNFDVAAFFDKWLRDMAADQCENGAVPKVIPNVLDEIPSSAWGDAATICVWEMYIKYGDIRLVERQYPCMKSWVEYIRAQGDNEFLWNTGFQYGDWLAMDSKEGSYVGATSTDLIATAYYAYSTELLVKAARLLNRENDVNEYETLYNNILTEFNNEFVTKNGRIADTTQTANVLPLKFNLVKNKKRLAETLNRMIIENGRRLTTGFVGVSYLCPVLSEYGYDKTAYDLLLQTEFPSWLYSVLKGATTIWEHWDGIKPDGSFWSRDMNSYNHYSYGAIADWMYTVMAGIKPSSPAYKTITVKPVTDERISYVKASIETLCGRVVSEWETKNGKTTYTVEIPANTTAEFVYPDGTVKKLGSGKYTL